MVPRGKHQIMICRGTGCHVRGSDQILAALEKQLGVKEGETTKDGRFSLSPPGASAPARWRRPCRWVTTSMAS